MTAMTYRKATGILEEAGFVVDNTAVRFNVKDKRDCNGIVGMVTKTVPYQMDTAFAIFTELTESDQFLIANTLRTLMMTKLDNREDEQLYYVNLIKGTVQGYLVKDELMDAFILSTKNERSKYKTKFTKAEIMAIDPNYWPFAVPVEEIDNE